MNLRSPFTAPFAGSAGPSIVFTGYRDEEERQPGLVERIPAAPAGGLTPADADTLRRIGWHEGAHSCAFVLLGAGIEKAGIRAVDGVLEGFVRVRRFVHAHAVGLAAGMVGEQLAGYDATSTVAWSEADRRQLDVAPAWVRCETVSWPEAARRAHRLLEPHRGAVETVAHALVGASVRGLDFLPGHALEELIERVLYT